LEVRDYDDKNESEIIGMVETSVASLAGAKN